MSKEAIAKKAEIVDGVADQFTNSMAAIVVDARGLTVAEVTELRKQLREEGVKMQVIKNKILSRAAEKAGFEGMDEVFSGPSAVAFSDEDPVAPAKVLKKFADDNDNLTIKGGIIEGAVADIDKINTFATMPSRDDLLAMLANEFMSPVRDVAYALKAVADKKAEEEVA
ncbi:50S ribosomal protein L10 [Pediococcus claussenii]|uniref:Large ribosomal subunit protein uL10 n=1 Tax=Pediococcus claussenii (strain ATCC BAA-344 / DSM 14800 / JCM 18046 / KCTC 3811 / LMG 21948 / P06) TaxID=701521 RepID=G8PBM7_PEDCP|nr:50S ribosomal protein L10 [Pediococcus claussenii]AEV94776.1 50S ribosomal protein L10 [Pediococcus claussenii ATCC BAA-344]ANZ69973.1 50S ribosomal protein L10 [Pediococcus claussenii]ANZ71789.1 50S ribosomal protein L10 [Pediococcus claussenii]KRN20955.1 rplJ protein [Pediococcus claussenii]